MVFDKFDRSGFDKPTHYQRGFIATDKVLRLLRSLSVINNANKDAVFRKWYWESLMNFSRRYGKKLI
jgi:hypothetical protein